MVHTELFGKKSRTFQGLKSFFQGPLYPNNMIKDLYNAWVEGCWLIAIQFVGYFK